MLTFELRSDRPRDIGGANVGPADAARYDVGLDDPTDGHDDGKAPQLVYRTFQQFLSLPRVFLTWGSKRRVW